MSIPDYQTLMLPVLKAARQGEVRISEVIGKLADEFHLTDAERAEMLPSGRITLFANRVHWAKTYLKQAGLIEQTRRSYFRMTARGRQAIASGLDRIDNKYLSQFAEFIEFKTRSRRDDEVETAMARTRRSSSGTFSPPSPRDGSNRGGQAKPHPRLRQGLRRKHDELAVNINRLMGVASFHLSPFLPRG